MFKFFRKNKKVESNINKFNEEKLYEILDRIRNYNDYCDFFEGLSSEEIELKNEIILQDLFVKIPNDYKLLLNKSNGIYFGNSISFLNIDEIIEKTKSFKNMMEDWEIGKIPNPFLEVVRYHDGHGFVFWYDELKKYVVVDYISDYELDDIDSLKTFDNICDVIEYFENDLKKYFNI